MLSAKGEKCMNPIYEGTIKKENQHEQHVSIQILTINHLPSILFVQEQILLQLQDRGSLQPLSKEEFQYILGGNGLMLGAFVEDELIAFRALLVPPIDEEHLGRDIGLKDEELQKVIYQEISNVLPAYRGNQLQKIFAILIMQELSKQTHSYRYVCCTVSPFNIPSLKDKFSQGMEILSVKEKYNGLLRYIFVKDLEEVSSPNWQDINSIKIDDVAAQQTIIAEGWRGFQMDTREGELWIDFGRK